MLQVNEWQRLLAETERDILAAADKTGKGFYLDLEGREAQIVPLRQASTSTNSAERFAGGATAMTSADQVRFGISQNFQKIYKFYKFFLKSMGLQFIFLNIQADKL